jgi:hypothetical protein
MITKDRIKLVPELESSQEEADTRLLLHAAHAAASGISQVVIVADDTDVLVLGIAFCSEIPASLYQKTGTSNRTKIIDIGKVANACGINVCLGIIGLHAFTGCDSNSSFAGKGKVAAFKMLKSDPRVQQTFKEVGNEWNMTVDLFHELETFTCKLYGCKLQDPNINDLRYQLFCTRKGEIESHHLPPCSDCLKKHGERSNYQAAIWKRALQRHPNTPNPTGYGWKMDTIEGQEVLALDWMDGAPAPECVLELLACTCTRSCKPADCPCKLNGLKCSYMCKLTTCDNQGAINGDESDTELLSDDEVDEDES